ncbi:MAG TPA: hypothetical protein VKR43_20135 [Bryobacteraceae bacterium]|nr:hypothetical protein [Bryobacteraceae bacterium]
MKLLAVLFWLAAPFWEAKAPVDWTELEITQLLTDSPWAQMLVPNSQAGSSPVQMFLATAAPIEQAEHQWDLRFKKNRPGAPANNRDEEFQAWLNENRAKQIVIAVLVNLPQALSDEQETRRMQDESVMRVGRKKLKMTGYFPPSAADRYLRLAFPREVTANDKTVTFDLYLPGVPIPFRQAEFKVKDMLFKGKLEM